ncbi:PilZN3 domain-containing protein [Borreliella garinii]|uniref:PilZN3 domain-containing protein n=1 Tax=Borreliella garinii TaxID=29519 RepID=UPI0039779DA4
MMQLICSIYLSMKLLGIFPYYSNNREYNILTLEFLSSIPEDTTSKIRKLIELKFYQNRKIYERIVVYKDSVKKLKINFNRSFIQFSGVKHKCLIKDLSYGDVLVISFFDYEKFKKD